MKILVIAAAVVAITSASSFAADLEVKAPLAPPAPPAPITAWGGFYIGGEVGAAWGQDRVTDLNGLNPPTASYTVRDLAVMGSGELGYNWQIQDFVFGLEGNLGGIGLGKTAAEPSSAGFTTSHIGSGLYGDVAGRLGVSAGNILYYVKGGYAFYDAQASVTNTGAFGGGTAATGDYTSGWTAGGGFEYIFAPNLSMKLEYLHFDFGNQSATLVTPLNGNFSYSNRLTAETLQLGLNYHFH
jgi:outer membrane immunogenic protein